jgi:hypothetical protein
MPADGTPHYPLISRISACPAFAILHKQRECCPIMARSIRGLGVTLDHSQRSASARLASAAARAAARLAFLCSLVRTHGFLGMDGVHLLADGCSISSYWNRYAPSRGSKLARQCSQLAPSRFSA